MKRILLFILLAIALGNAYGQTLRYVYDAAGNQTLRYMIYFRSTSPAGEEKEENPAHKMLSGCEVTIYPNPTDGHLTVEIRTDETEFAGNLSLFTLQGQLITRLPLQIPYTELDLTVHPDGTYILQIETGDEKNSWKIIKQSL